MNRQIIPIKMFVFLLTCLFLTACYSNYYGIYHIGSSPSFEQNPASEEDNKKIYKVVKNVALEYGFIQHEKQQYDKSDDLSFGKGRDTKGKHEGLKGSEGPIRINILVGPYPEIIILDRKRTKESEFIKSLKIELEKRLAEVVNMEGVEFYRKHPLYW